MAINQLIQDPKKKPIVKSGDEAVRSTISNREGSLHSGFSALEQGLGLKVFSNLKKEYNGALLILESKDLSTSLVDIEKIGRLVGSLYSQGLGLLVPALETSQQLEITDVAELGEENRELQSELESCGPKLRAMVEERLEKNTKNLKVVKKFKDRIDELFCQVKLCKESIREIRLELPELISHQSGEELEKVMLELRTRVEFAQKVQAEYVRQGI